MIKTIDQLLFEYKEYSNIYNKIATEEKNNLLFKIKRGLYETNKNADPLSLANLIVYPSYISFETALSYYGMIPERVYAIKSATFMKNKIKEFENCFGTFIYQDINKKAYPYGIDEVEINGVRVQIASREKALLDMISIVSPRNSIKEIKALIFDDLRIDETIFDELNKQKMIKLCELYSSKSLKMLTKFIGEKND